MSQPLKNGVMQESQDNQKACERSLNGSSKLEPPLFQVIDAIPAIAWSNSPDGSNVFQNQRWLDYTTTRDFVEKRHEARDGRTRFTLRISAA